MTFINHQNLYYFEVINQALEKNVLALTPTGIGKTFLYTILLEYFSERIKHPAELDTLNDNIPEFNNLYNFVKLKNENHNKKGTFICSIILFLFILFL